MVSAIFAALAAVESLITPAINEIVPSAEADRPIFSAILATFCFTVSISFSAPSSSSDNVEAFTS
jgi:hypothetical protein